MKIQKQVTDTKFTGPRRSSGSGLASNQSTTTCKQVVLNRSRMRPTDKTAYEFSQSEPLDAIVCNKFSNRRNVKELLRQARDWFNSFRPTTEQYVQIAEMEKRFEENKLKCQFEMRRFF